MDTQSINPIGFYVHHHGTGHMRRTLNIIQHITRPVVIFSSLDQPQGLPENAAYYQLPLDIVDDYTQPHDSMFHYTPYSELIFERNLIMINAWRKHGIRHLYVDVSVEVAVLAKLHGLIVGYSIMQGKRTDPAHTLGYNASDYLLAHMAPLFDTAENRHTNTPLFYSGGISRFAKRKSQQIKQLKSVAIMLSPKAEVSLEESIIKLAFAFPDTNWHCIGFTVKSKCTNVHSHGVINEPLSLLERADIVIGAGGNNTIMEIASIAKPFICVPEPRPFSEQVSAAQSLERLNAAIYVRHFPAPEEWPKILQRVRAVDLAAFSCLVSDDAAMQAARGIEKAAELNN